MFVRLISLESCPGGFDKTVTRATNTQNRIGSRDFAALDPNQQRLASEFVLDGRQYVYKSGDSDPSEANGCSITDATIALACDREISLAVQAKREIGRLWDDIEKEPYTLLFNDRTNATDVWKAVQILRVVDQRLKVLATTHRPRADLVAVHGNRLILHRVFHDPRVRPYRASTANMAEIKGAASSATDSVFGKVSDFLELRYRNAYLASFFKNLNRCKELNDHLGKGSAKDHVAHTETQGSATLDKQKTLFPDQN